VFGRRSGYFQGVPVEARGNVAARSRRPAAFATRLFHGQSVSRSAICRGANHLQRAVQPGPPASISVARRLSVSTDESAVSRLYPRRAPTELSAALAIRLRDLIARGSGCDGDELNWLASTL